MPSPQKEVSGKLGQYSLPPNPSATLTPPLSHISSVTSETLEGRFEESRIIVSFFI